MTPEKRSAIGKHGAWVRAEQRRLKAAPYLALEAQHIEQYNRSFAAPDKTQALVDKANELFPLLRWHLFERARLLRRDEVVSI